MTEQTSVFFLKILGEEMFDFLPGQFITFDLPIHEKKSKRLKSYSIASNPTGDNVIELVIVKLDNGLGTGFLFDPEKCKPGTHLTFRGPAGVFVLPKDLDKPHFLVCTGTGIAPFRSMVKHLALQKIPFKEIHILFGSRTKADLLYFDEMKNLEKELPNFYYHPILSREKWEGPTGYVHELYKTLAPRNAETQFMLCGWRPMIDQARTELASLNYTKEQIHFELYG